NIKAYLYKGGQWDPKSENSFSPALCNRIDRNTGGIVIAAKTAEALRIIDEKIRTREIDKRYLAAIHGTMRPKDGELRGYIFKDAKQNRVYVRSSPEKGAKSAATRYRTLAEKDGLSLVECELLTGRTHQIRAQLAAAGHPLVGDGKYGTDKLASKLGIPGQALYSYKLTFAFKSDAGALNYLNGSSFSVPDPEFVEKLFDLT
ncbi:MAG: RluA family pseudouridine synthase, partial [Oscillospiraceae bacterium]